MILIKLKPWQSIPGINHIKTKWEIADSESFANILESLETSDMLETYFSTLYVPPGSTYYVRATRIFDTGLTTTLDPIPTVNFTGDNYNLILKDDVIIDIPFVYVNKNEILSNADNIYVSTSEFRAVGDNHLYTHWIVMDGKGYILYCNLYDKVNLISISIENNSEWKNKTQLKFIAIHGSYTCIESPVGYNLISLTEDYNFEISGLESDLEFVEPLKDFTIVFNPIDNTKSINIFKVELVHYSSEEFIVELDKDGNNYIIPWFYLQNNLKYKICIYAYDKNLNYGKVYKTISVRDYNYNVIKKRDYVYKNKIQESITTTEGIMLPDINTHSECFPDNTILLPNNILLEPELWGYEGKILKNFYSPVPGITLPNNNYEGALIKPISKRLILIDVLDRQSIPTFFIYLHSNHTFTYSLEKSIQRQDETACLGKTNAIIQISTFEFIYNPIGTNKLRLLNIQDFTITDLEDIPMENLTKAILIKLDTSSILICNGTSYRTKIYNYHTKTYTDGVNFGPASYIGADLRTVRLINGDTAIIKLTEDTSGDPSIITWDFSNNVFVIDENLVFTQKPPKTTILCGNGDIYMGTYIHGDITQGTHNSSHLKVYY